MTCCASPLSSSPLQKLSVSPTIRITPASASSSTRCAPATTWTCSSPVWSASTSSPWPWSTTSSPRYGDRAGGHAWLWWDVLMGRINANFAVRPQDFCPPCPTCLFAPSFVYLPAQTMAFGNWALLHLSLLVECKRVALKTMREAGLFALLDEIIIEIFHLTQDFHPKKKRQKKKKKIVKCLFLRSFS